jgi:5'(3')-deoxyribonucleotidase
MIRIYVDMDDTLCDFLKMAEINLQRNPSIKYPQSQYGFFTSLPPIYGAIHGYKELEEMGYDVWILTRPSVKNPLCYTEKRVWVENWLGLETCDKLILCPDKALLKGDYLIDDQPWDGFEGTQLLFGSDEFLNWQVIIKYFKTLKENETT